MTRERMREVLTEPLTAELLARRANEGWRPVAVEWRRDSDATEPEGERIDVPFGLEVAPDGDHLRKSEPEIAVLRRILAQVVDDRSLSEIADSLNDEGSARRDGSPWTQPAIFELLPRVIEEAPSIYASEAWQRERGRARRRAG